MLNFDVVSNILSFLLFHHHYVHIVINVNFIIVIMIGFTNCFQFCCHVRLGVKVFCIFCVQTNQFQVA